MILWIVVTLGFVVAGIALKLLWDKISEVKRQLRRNEGADVRKQKDWGTSNRLVALENKVESLHARVHELEEAEHHKPHDGSDSAPSVNTSKGGRVVEWNLTRNRDLSSQNENVTSWDTEQFKDDYNSLLSETLDRSEFEKRYAPLRFGVKNSEERFRNSRIEPEFGEKQNGRYWAMSAKEHFIVVPIPMTIRGGDLREGALDQLFDCEELPEHGRYRVRYLSRPAAFEKASAGGWSLVREGQLELEKYA